MFPLVLIGPSSPPLGTFYLFYCTSASLKVFLVSPVYLVDYPFHTLFNKRTVLYYPLDNGFMQIVAHLRRRGAVSYLNHEVFVKVLREEEYKRTGKFNGRLR